MRRIKLENAEASLAAVVEEAMRGRASLVTRDGKPQAVVLGFADWQLLTGRLSFGRLLMAAPLDDGDVERKVTPMRDTDL